MIKKKNSGLYNIQEYFLYLTTNTRHVVHFKGRGGIWKVYTHKYNFM